MAGLVTILCHSECLGAWTSFWTPCRRAWPFAARFKTVFKFLEKERVGVVVLVLRSDICSWRCRIDGRECMEAAIEHLGWLLYPKLAHHTFTIPAFRLVKLRLGGNGMRLEGSHVLLKFSWLVVTLFGPCLPILNTLIALLAKIYPILLFGCDAKFLDVKPESVTQEREAGIPSFGSSMVALLAFALQLSNLL
eukprot:6464528-Amphidinium_carterae.1